MFTDPMFYENTDDALAEEERKRRIAASLPPAQPVALSEPDLPPLAPINAADVNGPAPLEPLPKWTSRDQFNEDLKTEPKLQRPGGWKGALQRVGEIGTKVFLPALSNDIMHPKYTDQMRDYQRKIGQDIDLMKSEEMAAENARKQSVAERQMAASNATAAAAAARQAYTEKQADALDKPKPQNVISVNSPAIYDPNTKTWSKNPYYQEKKGTYQQKLDAMKEQVHIANPELTEDEAYQVAAKKMLDYQQSAIDRNRGGTLAAGASAGLAGANTNRVTDEIERKKLEDKATALADKALADSEAKGEDIGTAIKNVTNRNFYGWAGDDTVLNRAAEILREKQAKRKSKASGLLSSLKNNGGLSQSPSGASMSAQPSSPVFATPDEVPPPSMVQSIGEGQALRSPSGQIWEKKDGKLKRVK